jgi:hypothetical protein
MFWRRASQQFCRIVLLKHILPYTYSLYITSTSEPIVAAKRATILLRHAYSCALYL